MGPPSPTGVDTPSLDALLWSECEKAMELGSCLEYENVAPNNDCVASPYVAYLPDGDIHVCGPKCPHLFLNDDRCYVCSLSGIVYGSLSLREDYSTGRQAGSADPDAHAGEPVGGTWKPRKDMRSLSNQAYEAAEGHDLECETAERRRETKPVLKRGARCVDEPVTEDAKRQRTGRRNANGNRQQLKALADDAEQTIIRLVNFDKKADNKSTSGKAGKQQQQATKDPRLLDPHAIFTAAMKKYVKECLANGTAPTLDAVHNICITAQNIADQERKKQQVAEGHSAIIMRVQMRQIVTALAVALWKSCCSTPYMANHRRGADSFRPFVCGLLYALKRGVELPDGTPVVPQCPTLAEALPALRATAVNSMAKALHASSHRGLCTLHRCISSCSKEQAETLFEDSARIANQIHNAVSSGSYGF